MRSRTLGAALVVAVAVVLPAPARAAGTAAEAGGSPAEVAGAAAGAGREAERQADLVAGEDQRLTEALVAGIDPAHPGRTRQAYRVRSSGLFTLVLTRRKAAYTFDDLRRLAPDTLVAQAKGTFLLRENIVVAEGATLTIAPTEPLRIRMSSGPEGFVSLVTIGGRLRLHGTAAAPIALQSWDGSRGRPDTDVTDGRAYVRASGQFVVRHTEFSRLGFWSGRTGGVSVVGSGTPVRDIDTGAVAEAGEDDPVAERASGKASLLPAGRLPSSAQGPGVSYSTRISDATMTGNAFGLFVTGSSGATITDTVILASLVDGLVLHRDVESASVSNVRVEGSGADGVVVTRKVEGTLLTRLLVRRNGRDGVVLAGKPLADGPSASGQSTRPFGNNTLTASESSGNARIGVHVIGGTAVRVAGNTVTGGRAGIVVSDGAADVEVDSNRVEGARANGIQVRESGTVAVTGNVVRDSPTGIHVRNSSGRLVQNSTSGVTLHGITFVGRVAGSTARQNLVSGSGTSAIDLVRVTGEEVPRLAGNDLTGWSRTVTGDSLAGLLLHPLTVIWIFVACALLAMSRPRRGGPGLPYQADPLGRRNASVTSASVSVEPTREREIPVFAIPESRVPVPAQGPAGVPRGTPAGAPSQVPAQSPAVTAGHIPAARPVVQPGSRPPVQPTPGPVVAPDRRPLIEPALRPATGPAAHPVAEPALRPAGEPALRPATGPAAHPVVEPALPSAGEPALRPAAVTREQRTVPPLLPIRRPEPPNAGPTVIDLAIREARLNPVAPRRRRVNGR